MILGSGIAIPFTGGTSAALTYLGYAAATASAVQCANGSLRSYAEIKNPQLNDWLDSKEWYTNTAMAVDAVSLAGVGASTVMLARIGQTLKSASSRSTIEVLKGMTRAERKRLTQEIIKLNHPGVSGKVMKSLIAGGKYPKRYTQGQISQALTLKVQEAVGASISFIGSASSGIVKSIFAGVAFDDGKSRILWFSALYVIPGCTSSLWSWYDAGHNGDFRDIEYSTNPWTS